MPLLCLHCMFENHDSARKCKNCGKTLESFSSMRFGNRVDTVPGAKGRFGYDISNPVPVKSPMGQMEYLATLQCGCGQSFQFNRAGSVGSGPDGHMVDAYNLVCRTGKHSITLYMDMYHAGPTSLVPEGLTRVKLPPGAGLPVPGSIPPPPPNPDDLPPGERGIFLASQGKYEEALKCFDEILKTSPADADAWCNRGLTLKLWGKYEEAIECYDKALNIAPRNLTAFCNKSAVLDQQGKHEEAIELCDRALEIHPKSADLWNNKGLALRHQGKNEEAIRCYDKALEIDPLYPLAWKNKVAALEASGKSEESKTCNDMFMKVQEGGFCWFCKKNPADKNSASEVELTLTGGGVEERTTIKIPRCAKCDEYHSATGCFMIFFVFIGIILSALIWFFGKKYIPPHISTSTVIIVTLLLSAFIGWICGLIKGTRTPEGIPSKTMALEHPSVKEFTSRGYKVWIMR